MLTRKCKPYKFIKRLILNKERNLKKNRFSWLAYDLLYGIQSRIPFCCVIEWSARQFIRFDRNMYSVEFSNPCNTTGLGSESPFGPDSHPDYVHCWIHRKIYNHI